MIHDSIAGVIGNTPLVRLNRVARGIECTVAAKLEFLNPGGSVKDRIGPAMIEEAERRGVLKPGGTVIEATSGNTGMGLVLAAVAKGYKMIFTMPDKMSQEKIDFLKAFGAKVIVTPTSVESDDPRSYSSVAKRLVTEIPGAFSPDQFDNPVNPQSHYATTGPEIWEQTEGKIDVLVGGMGTGGTMAGCGRYLKEKNPNVKLVAADPEGSIYASVIKTGKIGDFHSYKVEGIGEDVIPTTSDLSVIDDAVSVSDKDAFNMARRIAREEAMFVGGSSGAAVVAALEVAKGLGPDKLVVVMLPDTGRSYLSKCFNDAWMEENQFIEESFGQSAFDILMPKESAGGFISIGPDATVEDAVRLMREHEISQIPVLDSEGKSIGVFEETRAIDLLTQPTDVTSTTIDSVMSAPLPEVDLYADVAEISRHLTGGSHAVLVRMKTGSYSIITKFDLLHARR